jgi:hypothetical protein
MALFSFMINARTPQATFMLCYVFAILKHAQHTKDGLIIVAAMAEVRGYVLTNGEYIYDLTQEAYCYGMML